MTNQIENTKGGFKHIQKFLNKQDKFLSIIDFENSKLLKPSDFKSKLDVEFVHSKYSYGEVNILEIIYKTKSGYFIYMSKTDELDSYYYIKILFEPTHWDDVIFLLKNLSK